MIEIPITTCRILNQLYPAAGGGFFRLYPYRLSRLLIRRVNQGAGEATVFYFHPWEMDPKQPRQKGINLKTRFRHYINLDKTKFRLEKLLEDFDWGRMDDVFVKRDDIPDVPLEQLISRST